jgi:hypothetical protein
MKKYIVAIAFALVFMFSGCKQDFDITADYKEVPVVYGLLNQQDAKHYIRIQKGYLIDGDARVASGITDSIYYPDVLTVKLIVLNPQNGNRVDSATLTRIDGNDPAYGLQKDSGLFANIPNWLYTTNKSLNPDRSYLLEVTNNSNGYKFSTKVNDSKSVNLIKDFAISTPSYNQKLNLSNQKNTSIKVLWTTAQNAGIYDLTVRFPYKEYRTSDNALLLDTFVEITFLRSLEYEYNGLSINPPIEITSDNFLTQLSKKLIATTDVYREFNVNKGMQFKVAAGGTDLTNYIRSARAQGGLSSNEALAPYTNIDGGVGILSSRYFKQVDSVLFTPIALDSLACSDLSRPLRFKNHSGVLCN